MSNSQKVCVTGGSGFIASHLVKHLLSKDYIVHATVRDLGNERCAHLMKLEKAKDNLRLFKADLLDYGSIHAAISGCHGVFLVASPVKQFGLRDPEVELMKPAVEGTLNVLQACSTEHVKRTVYVSSLGAVCANPNWPKGKVRDESCWSDIDHCKSIKHWYFVSKTEAELRVVNYARTSGLDVISVCPAFVFGPLLIPTVNQTTGYLISLFTGGLESVGNRYRAMVDVRDLAEALMLVYEKPEAKGRYICASHILRDRDLVDKLKVMFPNFNYPRVDDLEDPGKDSSEKHQKLGWRFRPLEESLIDTVNCYRKARLLPNAQDDSEASTS